MVTKLTYDSGLGQGLSSLGAALGEALKIRSANEQLKNILNPQGSQNIKSAQDFANDEGFRNNFLDVLKQYENETGEMVDPEQVNFMWNASVQKAQQEQQQAQSATPQYNMQQLAAIAQRNPQLASMLQQNQLTQQKMEQQRELAQEKRAYQSNEPFFKEVDTLRNSIPNQEVNLLRIGNVLNSKDLGSLRNLASEVFSNKIPPEYIATASANELKSAVKDAFVADLKSLPSGSRLNQFIEKNLLSALESPLKSPENNQIILEAQKFDLEKNKKKVEITDRLLDAYAKAGREPPARIAREVDRQLKPFVDQQIKDLTKKIMDIKEGNISSFGSQAMDIAKERITGRRPEAGNIWMLSPTGDIKQVPKNLVKQAIEAGGSLIK